MNQRRDARFPTDHPVALTVFGKTDLHLSARVRNVSGRGLGLEVDQPLPTGAALKILLEDAIVLGEVIYCRNQEGLWYVGVELEQALCGLAELASALRSFSEVDSGPEKPDAVKHAGHQDQQ